MRRIQLGNYIREVMDIASFVLGVVLGTLITAFSAVGSHSRGFDSLRRGTWRRELVARKRAVKATTTARFAAKPALQPGFHKAS